MTDPCEATGTDTADVNINDVLGLEDESNDHRLRLFPCSGRYIWQKPDGTEVTHFATITVVSGVAIQFANVPSDLNLLKGRILLSRRLDNARLTEPRGHCGRTSTIVDADMDDNGPCP